MYCFALLVMRPIFYVLDEKLATGHLSNILMQKPAVLWRLSTNSPKNMHNFDHDSWCDWINLHIPHFCPACSCMKTYPPMFVLCLCLSLAKNCSQVLDILRLKITFVFQAFKYLLMYKKGPIPGGFLLCCFNYRNTIMKIIFLNTCNVDSLVWKPIRDLFL